MTKPIVRIPIYRERAFDAEIIDLCARWHITYRLLVDTIVLRPEKQLMLINSERPLA